MFRVETNHRWGEAGATLLASTDRYRYLGIRGKGTSSIVTMIASDSNLSRSLTIRHQDSLNVICPVGK